MTATFADQTHPDVVNAVVVDRAPGEPVSLSYESRPRPRASAGHLVVAPCFVGVCGSDLELVAGHSDADFPITYPHVLGHEWSGLVVEVGEAVAGFTPGDLVVGHGALGSNHWFGVTDDGAMADLFEVPAAMCFTVPDGITAKQAAMVEPLACVLQGLHRAGGADASHTVVVLGCGTLGLAMVGLLASTGATVVAVDPSEQRRSLARRLGATLVAAAGPGVELLSRIRAELGVDGADLVVEASGAAAAQSAALEVTAPGARVLLMGLAHEVAAQAPLRLVQARLLTVLTSVGAPAEVWEPALRLMKRTGLDLTPAVSDVFTFAECRAALDAAARPSTSGKVMLQPVSDAGR
jgi:threonine dehydrogenase-like Zn-dependent dehydrogenase